MCGRPSEPTVASRPMVWDSRYSISRLVNALIGNPSAYGLRLVQYPPRVLAETVMDTSTEHRDHNHAPSAGAHAHGAHGDHAAQAATAATPGTTPTSSAASSG